MSFNFVLIWKVVRKTSTRNLWRRNTNMNNGKTLTFYLLANLKMVRIICDFSNDFKDNKELQLLQLRRLLRHNKPHQNQCQCHQLHHLPICPILPQQTWNPLKLKTKKRENLKSKGMHLIFKPILTFRLELERAERERREAEKRRQVRHKFQKLANFATRTRKETDKSN